MRIVRFIITCLLLAVAGRVSAQSGCVPVALPLAESFDSYGVGGMPPCWCASRNYDMGLAPHLDSTQRHSGSASLYLYSGSLTGSHYSMAIGPEMDIANAEGLYASFHLYAASTSTLVEVGLCDDTNRYTRQFVPLDTLHVDRTHHWQEMVVDLSAYSGTGRRLAFRLQRGLQSENCECYIDDLYLGNCGTTTPVVHHIGSTTMTVEWQTFGQGDVTLEYNGLLVANAVSPLTLTGLTPSTAYTIAVSCDGGAPHQVTATTLEGAGLFPTYYEPFDGNTLPAGWRSPTANHATVEGQRLTLRPAGDSCLAVLPLHDLDSTQGLKMALLLEADSGTCLTVGVMDFADETAAFTAVDSLTGHGRRAVSMASYDGTGRYLALLATGNGTLRVDDLRVAHCLVDNVRLYNLTESSVTVAWDTLLPATGTEVTVEWGPRGFAPGSGTFFAAPSNPFTLNALGTSTAYDLLVYPACGDTPCPYDRHPFETFAHEVTAPYCLSFESLDDGLPQGWVCGQGSAGVSTLAYEGSRGLHLEAGTTVTLPRVSVDTADTLLADFYSQGNGSLVLGLMATPYSTFLPVDTLTGSGTWRHHVVPLAIPEGMLLAFRAATAWNLDAVALHRDAVETATVSAIGQTSAHVEWTMIHGDSVEVEYSAVASATADFADGSGTVLHALDSVTLHGLAPGSHYALHLRPLSDSAGDGCQWLHLHLLTDATSEALPFCQNFDDLTDFPSNWRRKSEMGEYPIISTERNHSPRRSMRFSATATRRTVAVLPDFESPSDSVVLSFWTTVRLRPAGAKLFVGHLADLDDLDSFTPIDTLTFDATETWQHHNVYLDTLHSHVALMLVGGSNSETRLFVDDLCIEPCMADNISVRMDSTQATLRWRSHGVAAMEVTVSGSGLSRRDTFYTSPAVVDSLTPDASYTVKFNALCACGSSGGTHYSGYGSTGNVTTDTATSTGINTHSPMATTPYCLTFESSPTGRTPNYWRCLGGSATVSDRNYHDGSHGVMTGNHRLLILRPIDSVQRYIFSFFAYCSNEALLADSAVQIGVMDDPDSADSFTLVAPLRLTRAGEWQRLWCDLAHYEGTGHHIALRMPGSDTSTLFLDDISFFPCDIVHAEVSGDGVVTWVTAHDPTAVVVEYGPQGFLPGDGIIDTVTAPPYSLQGITVGNNYDIYLTPLYNDRSHCIPLKIILGAAASTPYCEHFETAPLAGMPAGWSIARTHSGTPAIGSGSSQTLRLAGHSAATSRSIAVLPLLASDDSLQLSLSMRCVNPSVARLAVGFIASTADPNTFVPVDTLANDATNRWQRLTTRLMPPADSRIALSCLSTGQETTVVVDSLAVTRGVSPLVAATSARTLALTGSGYIEYGPAGTTQGNGTLLLLDTPQTLAGLTPEQEYWFYSREDSTTLTCMTPVKVVMPAEVPLPYCQGGSSFQQLQLPEMAIDSVNLLHLYLTLAGGGTVVAGVMERDGDWQSFVAVDTLTAPTGTRRQLHASLARYGGNHRFVGLRSVGGTVTMERLTVTACEWPEAELRDDNSVMLRGHGAVEYGPAGFTLGSGTLVTLIDSLLLDGLADTTLYDYYPLCNAAESPCQPPQQWHTSTTVALPTCFDFSQGLPTGWTSFSDALNANAVRADATGITLAVAPGQHVGVTLPLMESPVVDCEMWRSNGNVALVVDGDTLQPLSGTWQPLQLRHTGLGRLTLEATGNGSVKLRNLEASACALPRQLAAGQPGDGQVEVLWDTTGVETPFYIEYRLHNAANAVTVRAEQPPLTLQLLPDTLYTLTAKCDSLGSPCRQGIEVATLSNPRPVPYCVDFEGCPAGQVPEGWYVFATATGGQTQVASGNAFRGSRRLHVVNSQGNTFLVLPQFNTDSLRHLNLMLYARAQRSSLTLTIGTMTDAGDPSTFDPAAQFVPSIGSYMRCFHSFNNYYGNGRFIALRLDGNGWMDLDDLSVSDCAAYNFRLSEIATDYVVLEWEQQGSPEVSVEYGPMGFTPGSGTVATAQLSPLRIEGLSSLSNYIFYVGGNCSDVCRPTVTDTFRTFTPQGGTGCIDYTDLTALYVSCAYGSYANPSENSGVVDYGYLSPLSRHTIHFDTAERDPRTGNLLRTVPEGKQASVRLGNWTTGSGSNPQAESITYGLTVDTNQFSLLVLRYAAVLQDPEHSADLQPRFRLQILNQEGSLIDSTCGMADFIANPTLVGTSQGWNNAANEVLWKDWTTVGLDLSAYAGQTILIRLITNDCGEGSHFGYAYFTLECASKQMQTEGCSYVPDNRFTVPQGFHYRWYTNHDTTTVSDSSSLWVASDNNTTYYCQLSFVDNPACHFTMSAFAGARFPLALIDTALTVANCEFDLALYNRSTISGDGVTPVGTGESCETSYWTLPDSSTSESPSLTLHFADTGSYTFILVAGIANDQCLDTLQRTIHITYPHPATALDGSTQRCDNDGPDTVRVLNATSYTWSDGSSGDLLFSPLHDTTVTCFTVDTNGCRDTLSHFLHVKPTYALFFTDSVCNTDTSYLWLDTTIAIDQTDGILGRTRHLTTTEGCDSLHTLVLTLMPSYDIHHSDTLCDNQSMTFFDTTLATTGNHLHVASTSFGCDSLVTMHLAVMPTYHPTDSIMACDSLRWQNDTLYTADTTGVLFPLHSQYGCDSIIVLALTVHPSYHLHDSDSICNNASTYPWRDTTLVVDSSQQELSTLLSRQSIHHCDSIMTLNLTLMPSYDIHHRDTLCHDIPLPFFDTVLTTTGSYLHSGSTDFGCDSLVTMHLEVIPRRFSDDIQEACDSMTWIDGHTYHADTVGAVDTLYTPRGCDSVVTLHLTVHRSTYEMAIDTFCQGSQYLWRSHTLTDGGYYTDTLATQHSCDSVLAISLTRLDLPQVDLTSDYDCATLQHQIVANSDARYILWTSSPYDPDLSRQEHRRTIQVNPHVRTLYMLYADYGLVPRCPVTDTIIIAPITRVEANLKVLPQALIEPYREFDAYDIGNEYSSRLWMVNGEVLNETSRHLHYTLPEDVDTAWLLLLVSDGTCDDTATAMVPILGYKVAAPNAFTPDRDNNNTFRIHGRGIVSAEIRIFNRLGAVVFKSNDINREWDGRDLNGNPCPAGGYVWQIRFTSVVRNNINEEKGSVILIR